MSLLALGGAASSVCAISSAPVLLEYSSHQCWFWERDYRLAAALASRATTPRKRNRHKSRARFHWVYRRKLPFHAAMNCHHQAAEDGYQISTTSPVALRRWRKRRNYKARARMKRRRTIAHEFFLKPAVKPHFLLKSAVPPETLDAFCADRGEFFLGFPKLMKKLEFKEHGVDVQSTVGRANLLTSEVGSSL